MRISFRIERGFREGQEEEIWKRLSDVGSIPRYWRGHRDLRVIAKSGSLYVAWVKYAFPAVGRGNEGHAVIEVDDRSRRLRITSICGPVRGTIEATVDANGRKLACTYDVSISSIYLPFRRFAHSHFLKGAESALERLAEGT
ncbi:MAG: hypothetical protein ACP5LW_03005 [Nitrososphaeria archaeon]